jgi:hypothetical protein
MGEASYPGTNKWLVLNPFAYLGLDEPFSTDVRKYEDWFFEIELDEKAVRVREMKKKELGDLQDYYAIARI